MNDKLLNLLIKIKIKKDSAVKDTLKAIKEAADANGEYDYEYKKKPKS